MFLIVVKAEKKCTRNLRARLHPVSVVARRAATHRIPSIQVQMPLGSILAVRFRQAIAPYDLRRQAGIRVHGPRPAGQSVKFVCEGVTIALALSIPGGLMLPKWANANKLAEEPHNPTKLQSSFRFCSIVFQGSVPGAPESARR